MPLSPRVVVTGSSGFVGRAVVARLPGGSPVLSFGSQDWEARLAAADLRGATILHLAARVHAPGDDEAAFRHANVTKTRLLAEHAARSGARRLIYLSTIKVHGEESRDRPFLPGDAPAPEDAYARSKLAGERALLEVARGSTLETVIVRPPLVYGPGARANLAALLRLADTPWPLPFAALHARRSFIDVQDLARLLVACTDHPGAAGRIFLAAHRDGVSTAQVVSLMRAALGRRARLFSVSAAALETACALAGQSDKARRLTRPLLADPSLAMRELPWSPQVPIEHSIEEMVRDYRGRH